MDRKTHDGGTPSTADDREWERIVSPDPHDTAKRKRRKIAHVIIAIAAAIIIIALAAAAVMIGMRYIPAVMKDRKPHPSATATRVPQGEYTDSSGATNPASGKTYARESQDTAVKADRKQIILTAGGTDTIISLPSLSADIGAQPCRLKSRASSCYLGASKYGGDDVDVFAFRDAASSALLLTASKPEAENVKGATLSYLQKITVGERDDMNGFVIITGDQTGIMMMGKNLKSGIGTDAVVSTRAADAKPDDGGKAAQ